mmetsp:Transcript_16962/g.20800  ORF Transcript_16962/g.20800 Transcript_16962/m.20800 type:complete len:242 (-) Transcript_16962:203-928(-)
MHVYLICCCLLLIPNQALRVRTPIRLKRKVSNKQGGLGFFALTAVVHPLSKKHILSRIIFPMSSKFVWLQIATGVCGIASAIVGGTFLSFSDFLMRSLKIAGEPAGSTVMKEINLQVFHYVFIPTFMALVPSTIITAIAGSIPRGPWSKWLIASSVIYIFGCFLVTGMGNVPMNNQLAALTGSAQSQYWQHTYLPKWTLYNTIRTLACIASSVCSLIAYGHLAAYRASNAPTYARLVPELR